jgi:hypothetical protein
MSNYCEYCQLEVGKTYQLIGDSPATCHQVMIAVNKELAVYLGYEGGFHWFRPYHSRRCPICHDRLFEIAMPCFNFKDGLFVREEVDQDKYDELESHFEYDA